MAAAGAVTIEDSAPGLAAARVAGLACVALRTASTTDHDLGGADLVVGSLTELTLAQLTAITQTCRRKSQFVLPE